MGRLVQSISCLQRSTYAESFETAHIKTSTYIEGIQTLQTPHRYRQPSPIPTPPSHLAIFLASEHYLGSAVPAGDHVFGQLLAAAFDVSSQAQVANLVVYRNVVHMAQNILQAR